MDLPYLESDLKTLFSKRIGWLVALFCRQAVTSNILKYYQDVLSSIITLTFLSHCLLTWAVIQELRLHFGH